MFCEDGRQWRYVEIGSLDCTIRLKEIILHLGWKTPRERNPNFLLFGLGKQPRGTCQPIKHCQDSCMHMLADHYIVPEIKARWSDLALKQLVWRGEVSPI